MSTSLENCDIILTKWSEELGVEITTEKWSLTCTKAHMQSISTKFR